MLWLPTKKWHKAIACLTWRRRRQHGARLLLWCFVCFGLTTATAPPKFALSVEIAELTHAYQFDFVDWETQAITNEIWRQLWATSPQTNTTELIQTFLKQEAQLEQRQAELHKIFVSQADPQRKSESLTQELAILRAEQARLIPQVEMALVAQVESVLRDEGFTIAGHVFPPVAFRLIEPPTLLIISPRNKIERQEWIGLQPDLSDSLRHDLETALDQRAHVSSYITDLGGLGSYPTMVIRNTDLIYLVNTVIHEWVHNYLLTFPTKIAWAYSTEPQLRTINETTASIVGQELGRRVITRYYPAWIDRLPPPTPAANQKKSTPAKPSEYALTMRRIRQEVDRLLAEGKIEQAESFMEVERQKLVKKGYGLRKLNQAYFAFHGSYALSAGSIDPTGDQIRHLWAISPSAKSFLDRVGWLNSYEDYLAWLKESN